MKKKAVYFWNMRKHKTAVVLHLGNHWSVPSTVNNRLHKMSEYMAAD